MRLLASYHNSSQVNVLDHVNKLISGEFPRSCRQGGFEEVHIGSGGLGSNWSIPIRQHQEICLRLLC